MALVYLWFVCVIAGILIMGTLLGGWRLIPPFIWLAKLSLAARRTESKIAKSLEESPQDWEHIGYYIQHKSRLIDIWVANSLASCEVRIGTPGKDYGCGVIGSPEMKELKLTRTEVALIWTACGPIIAEAKRREKMTQAKALREEEKRLGEILEGDGA